jgi:c-di-GMP-binding flagellar brake protein YcgR
MLLFNIFALYPLQVDLADLWKPQERSPFETIILVSVIVAIAVLLVVLNARKKHSGTGSGSSQGPGFLARLALHRTARSLGLDREQVKMLDFIFKTDQVIDHEKSLHTQALLDRHFRRAYRLIDQVAESEQEKQSRLAVLFATRNKLENTVSGGITSTRQLKDDASVVLPHGKEKYSVAVISAKGEHLALECPKNALGSLVKIQRGDKLNLLAFTKEKKGFSFESRIIGYSTVDGQNAQMVAHSNNLKFLSQRRYRRRQTALACNIFLVYVEGKGKKQRLVVDKRRLAGTIADISVGGCSIKTKMPIDAGARLKIEFAQGVNNVAALGLILRANRTSGGSLSHIKFLRVTKKSMNLINAYVYEYISD